MLTDIVEKNSVRKVDFEKVKANVRVNKYDNHRLEQYTRRENIRIFNFSTARGEPLTEAVVNLLNEMSSFRPHGQDLQEGSAGATPPPHTHKFCAEEINVCHRTEANYSTISESSKCVCSLQMQEKFAIDG